MKKLFLIGGPMGVGKTAVAQCLKRELPNAVFLDGDWCWDASPFQVTEETRAMVLDNIRHVLNNFLRCTAYENVFFCWVMHEQGIIDAILEGLDTEKCSVKVLSLTADAETLTYRILRDLESGVRQRDVLERSLARLPLYEKLNSIKVDTTGKTVQEVADAVKLL